MIDREEYGVFQKCLKGRLVKWKPGLLKKSLRQSSDHGLTEIKVLSWNIGEGRLGNSVEEEGPGNKI